MSTAALSADNSSPAGRSAVATTRHHQRFLLRSMQFNEQFASMYRVRTRLLRDRVLERGLQVHAKRGEKTQRPPQAVRVLGLVPGVESLAVGTIYKTMKNFTGFLAEYQKELVRIEAGDDEDGEGMEDGEAEAAMGDEVEAVAPTAGGGEGAASSANPNNMCSAKDSIVLEDESGRVELSGIDADRFVTGMVVAVLGTLMEKGKFEVKEVFFPGAPQTLPRSIAAAAPNNNNDSDNAAPLHTPCYVAFVSGLGIGSQGEAPLALAKLLAYLVGDESVYAIPPGGAVPHPSTIAKLVIGGNIVEATEEHKLKSKVRLDPADHVRIADTANKATAANSMKSADALLAVIADSMSVDIMPGCTDPSNAYLPQQPLHPILLRATSKRPSARLVTNPYDVSYAPASEASDGANNTCSGNSNATRFFITSGQNVEDVLRQTSYPNAVAAMRAILECGCACPTAPNTLLSYPFIDKDPFTFPPGEGPHAMVCCNAEAFESELSGGVRFIAVPRFADSGELVLVDIASQSLNTVRVAFTV